MKNYNEINYLNSLTTVNFDERVKELNVLEYVKKLLQKYGLQQPNK